MPIVKPERAVKAPAESTPTQAPRQKPKAATVGAVAVQPTSVAAVIRPTPAPTAAKSPLKLTTAGERRAVLARRASVMLKFVSDPTRLQMVLFLSKAEHHVGALCEQLGQSQPAVSHHLALLRHGGIIAPRRMGKNNFYSLSGPGVELAKVVKSLMQPT